MKRPVVCQQQSVLQSQDSDSEDRGLVTSVVVDTSPACLKALLTTQETGPLLPPAGIKRKREIDNQPTQSNEFNNNQQTNVRISADLNLLKLNCQGCNKQRNTGT